LSQLKTFDVEATEKAFREVVDELKIGSSELVHPVRVALSGQSVGIGLFDTMSLLGKDKTVKRLQETFK